MSGLVIFVAGVTLGGALAVSVMTAFGLAPFRKKPSSRPRPRPCTCLGTCRGADRLGAGWQCVMKQTVCVVFALGWLVLTLWAVAGWAEVRL